MGVRSNKSPFWLYMDHYMSKSGETVRSCILYMEAGYNAFKLIR